MNIKGQIQGFALGAAITAVAMLAIPAVAATNQPEPESAPVTYDGTDPDAIAESFGLTLVWSVESCNDSANVDGCFKIATPDTIYVRPRGFPDTRRAVVLHEIGHAIQYRLGQPFDECAADTFAEFLGAKYSRNC